MRHYLPKTHIELITQKLPKAELQCALFDFDGTISLIREGWQQMMIDLSVRMMKTAPHAESEAILRAVATDFVIKLTGQPTIVQMEQLVTEIKRRGGNPLPAEAYKQQFVATLDRRVNKRVRHLEQGKMPISAYVVPGVLNILPVLRAQGLDCYLASGSDHDPVVYEAKVLGVKRYFNGGIYGAQTDGISKRELVQKILREYNLSGPELIVFGDGNDEIESAAQAGAIAVGVASNEATRQGVNETKRQLLIDVGADIIIPDFREWEPLLTYLAGVPA